MRVELWDPTLHGRWQVVLLWLWSWLLRILVGYGRPSDLALLWSPNPERRFAWNYRVLHRIAGGILIPIGFAAFSGIIK